ncbi:MAG: hypothetical protein E2581_19090 [Pseudomonas sp.]|uniref:hypothetical protein n=1 Tax=Pseudomonadota TaxID=1224 RepID=UPI0009446789|nr:MULTISPECIES: hypothetical protein [Pseudomonadota]MPT00581.1 hypothetical protein [Pseudomonas sp.]
MKITIDTNVPISANGRRTHAGDACQLACSKFLFEIATQKVKDIVVLDASGLILAEYTPFLFHSGQPGIGDVFFKYLHDNMYNPNKVELVEITPIDDESRGFAELPPNNMDPSDQKFLAIAVKTGATVVNALDTDWKEKETLMIQLKVKVRQLCPEHGCLI